METSRYWSSDAVGDGVLSPYDNAEFSEIWRVLFQRDRTLQGPIEGYLNELLVSNVGLTISVATGGALVDGKYYDSDAIEDFVLLAPVFFTRVDRVILRKSFALQTVRLAILAGVEGAGPTGLTQDEGIGIWEIPIAQVTITIVPTVTILDERTFSRTPLAEAAAGSLIHLETIVADGTSALFDFQNISQIHRHLFLIGQLRLLGAVVDADVDVRFNNDGGPNYNEQNLIGSNAVPSAAALANQNEGNVGTFPGATGIANHVGQLQIDIANYKDIVFFKTAKAQFVSIPNNTVANFDAGEASFTWKDTSAIDRITLISSAGNFIADATMSLYGIT